MAKRVQESLDKVQETARDVIKARELANEYIRNGMKNGITVHHK